MLPPDQLPNPGAKSAAPETNEKAFPKRADEPGDRVPSRADRQALAPAQKDVVVQDEDGYAIYTPAARFTAEQVAAELRSKGKPARVVTHQEADRTANGGATSLAADPNACAVGTARSFNEICPPPFWTNNGYADPQVRFNDHSGSIWPTDTAVYSWNRAVGIDSYYRWNSCPFQAGARCVDVFSDNYATSWAGLTVFPYVNAGQPFPEANAKVYLNDRYAPTNNTRKTVCHELGHVLGLGHAYTTASCMYFTPNSSSLFDGGSDDFAFLANLYSIPR